MTEEAVFRPVGTLEFDDLNRIVIYFLYAEPVRKRVVVYTDDMSRAFDKAIMGIFPFEIKLFLESLAFDWSKIEATVERRRQEFEDRNRSKP